ncbi:hypothetical protein ACGFJC_13060 [Nonomuraea fuscirosea]|uniref:hypothetical protein n=1 Tax=Nonomuraea fuscirosea TaxID=1291556 RepID=UPI003498310E
MTATATTGHRIYQGCVSLDWHKQREHWGGGCRRSCRFCHRLSFLLDDDGRPVHKVCLERALTSSLRSETEGRAA